MLYDPKLQNHKNAEGKRKTTILMTKGDRRVDQLSWLIGKLILHTTIFDHYKYVFKFLFTI